MPKISQILKTADNPIGIVVKKGNVYFKISNVQGLNDSMAIVDGRLYTIEDRFETISFINEPVEGFPLHEQDNYELSSMDECLANLKEFCAKY